LNRYMTIWLALVIQLTETETWWSGPTIILFIGVKTQFSFTLDTANLILKKNFHRM
jgi:hypothetical protein